MRSPSESAEAQREDYRNQKGKLLLREQTANLEGVQKRCFKCGNEKPLTEFYRHPQMADGRLGRCKECTKQAVAARAASPDGRERIREYERIRFQFASRKAAVVRYQKKRRQQDPQKYKARTAVGNALRDGKLIKGPCEICGDPKSQAHHHDYGKPLDVQWLCFKHHREIGHGQIVGSLITK